ncbi:MAG: anti-sigma factor family protein [Pyrinomonadaceae bacterium]
MQYLLGELSEEDQSRLEERYFADPSFFQEVRASRDDLIDAYLRGELSIEERARFEKYFMATPRRRERVEFARALMRSVDQPQEPGNLTATGQTSSEKWKSLLIPLIPYRRPIIALGILAIVFAGAWFLMRSQRGRTIEEAERASQPPNQNGPGAVETPMVSPNETNPVIAKKPATTPHAPSPRPEPKVVTFALSTGLVRDSAETKILAISKNVELVQLALEVERDDDRRYRAVLNTPEGQELWRAEIKNEHSKRGSTVVIRVPVSIFKNADYILSLSASTNEDKIVDVGKYYFRVHRK